jgi:hypothetical protein
MSLDDPNLVSGLSMKNGILLDGRFFLIANFGIPEFLQSIPAGISNS